MKKFFNKISNLDTYKKLFKEPMTYVAGAVLLAVLNTAHIAALGSAWGVTGPLSYWGAWIAELFGASPENWAQFQSDSAAKTLADGFINHGASIRNIGLILGALFSALLASQFKIKKLKSKKQVFAAIIGGLLMGYGARLSSGCNIGALFSAISAMSLSGWVFAIFMLGGAWIGVKLLVKFFM